MSETQSPGMLIGIVLAGGLSSRMGKDKALLTLDGQTFVARAAQVLADAGCQRLILSGFARAGWRGEVVPDVLPQIGPVGGLLSVLRYLEVELGNDAQPRFLVMVPVDIPRLSAECLEALLQPLLPAEGAGAQLCHFADSPLPMALRLDADTAAGLLAKTPTDLQQRSPSIRQFCADLRSVVLPRTPRIDACLCNVNTPDEFMNIHAG